MQKNQQQRKRPARMGNIGLFSGLVYCTDIDYEKSRKSADNFIALIEKHENFDNMTTTMLNEFVEKILVHERDRKSSVETTQEVEIYFTLSANTFPRTLGK